MRRDDVRALPLRTGFQYGVGGYIVSTEVSMFEGEMNRIAKKVEVALPRRHDQQRHESDTLSASILSAGNRVRRVMPVVRLIAGSS
jgi:hypothetical protein